MSAMFTAAASAYRFRNDNGTQVTATWMAAQNVDPSPIEIGVIFRLRFRAGDTGGATGTLTPRLRFRQGGTGGYSEVTDTTPVRLVTSGNVANGTATTSQLTGGSGGSFAAGQVREDNAHPNVSIGASGNTECEWVLEFDSTQVNDSDLFEFQFFNGNSSLSQVTASVTAFSAVGTITASDSVAVNAGDSVADISGELTASDTLAVAIGDGTEPIDSLIQGYSGGYTSGYAESATQITASDNVTVGITDTVQPRSVTVSVTDTITVAVLDVASNITVLASAVDQISLSVVDTFAELASSSTVTDILFVAIDDGVEVPLTHVGGTDVVGVGVTDNVQPVIITVSVTDILGLALDDIISGQDVNVAASDTVATAVTDTATTPTVSISVVDSLLVAVADIASPLGETVDKSASDSVTIGVADTVQSTVILVSVTDSITVGFTDTGALAPITVSVVDTVSVGLTDTGVILRTVSATDELRVAVLEPGSQSMGFVTAFDTLHIQSALAAFTYAEYFGGLPPDAIIDAILGARTQVIRRVEIYEADGVTPWTVLPVPDFIDGIVNVDQSRAERRTLDVTLYDDQGRLNQHPAGFWYDKIIKVFRGVQAPTAYWETQVGEFMIDRIDNAHFPRGAVKVTGRDYAKKMLLSKLSQATSFPANEPIEELIRTLALNSGVTKIDLPLTGANTQAEVVFDQNTDRWKVANDIAISHGYELFFRADGYLTLQQFQDPIVAPIQWIFQTGPIVGNLVSFTKSTNDSLLSNHVVVTGETLQKTPVWGEAKNTDPNSPTSIDNIGSERTYFYESAFVTSFVQCEEVAERFLKIRALEQFEVNITAIPLVWLDVGNIVQFNDPSPALNDPTRYLFSSFSIPLSLAPMTGQVRRVRLITA